MLFFGFFFFVSFTEGYRCEVKRPLAVCSQDLLLLVFIELAKQGDQATDLFLVSIPYQRRTASVYQVAMASVNARRLWRRLYPGETGRKSHEQRVEISLDNGRDGFVNEANFGR